MNLDVAQTFFQYFFPVSLEPKYTEVRAYRTDPIQVRLFLPVFFNRTARKLNMSLYSGSYRVQALQLMTDN